MTKEIDKQSNLKRGNPAWVKGVSGNKNGRPKKVVCVTSWLKEYADKKISDSIDIKQLTYAQASALSAWKNAVKGGLAEYNFIIDRIEGKVKDKVEVSGEGGGPVRYIIEVPDIETKKALTEYLNE